MIINKLNKIIYLYKVLQYSEEIHDKCIAAFIRKKMEVNLLQNITKYITNNYKKILKILQNITKKAKQTFKSELWTL